jgi:hypothetical protein
VLDEDQLAAVVLRRTGGDAPATGSEPTPDEPTGHQPTEHEPTGHEPTGHEPTGHEPTGHPGGARVGGRSTARGGLLQRDPVLALGGDPTAGRGPTAAPTHTPRRETPRHPEPRNTESRPAAPRRTEPRHGAPRNTEPRHAEPVAALRVAGREMPAIPAHALPHRPPRELLAMARRGLLEAMETRADGQRYATAHLAALRAAAAVLAARARPTPQRRGRPTSVWVLLTLVAPEMSEWAAYFAASAAKRSAAEAGIPRTVTGREADDLVRDTRRFIEMVEISLNLPHQPPLMIRAG